MFGDGVDSNANIALSAALRANSYKLPWCSEGLMALHSQSTIIFIALAYIYVKLYFSMFIIMLIVMQEIKSQ